MSTDAPRTKDLAQLRALIANARVRVAEVEAAQESVLDGCDAPMCGAAWDHLLKLEAELAYRLSPTVTASHEESSAGSLVTTSTALPA